MLAGGLYLNNTDSHIHTCMYIIYLLSVRKEKKKGKCIIISIGKK